MSSQQVESETALVLTGGGARAAYQVGVLQALGEITAQRVPFRILTGVSAGAINSAALAAFADDFAKGVEHLCATWRGLSPEQIYRTDLPSLLSIGGRWIQQLSMGGLLGSARVNALLDTAPLRALLEKQLSVPQIARHLATRQLRGLAVTATNYHTGTAVTFFDGADEIEPWVRTGRIGRREPVSIDHILASAAIPLFFPPVAIGGASYGDGCVRLGAPLSPAIHLGADRIVAIGIRYARTSAETVVLNEAVKEEPPTPSEIGGVLLNAVFLDSLDSDAERLKQINETLSLFTPVDRARTRRLRQIPLLVIRPSRDLGCLAIEQYRRLPRTLRYFLKGIGATGERGWDLVSYLAFEPIYIEMLMDLGYEDARALRAEVEAFFEAKALVA